MDDGGIMLWVAGFALVAALIVPGYLLIRSFGASRLAALSCAPVVMVGLYVVLGMALGSAGVFTTGPVLVGCALALAVAARGLAHLVRRRSSRKSFRSVALPCEQTPSQVAAQACAPSVLRRATDWLLLALYLVLGITVTAFMTASCLTSPESIVQEYDNVHHLGVVRAFLQSGLWSPFAANLYSAPDAVAFNPLPLGGFYPTAWSMLAALAASLTGCSVPVAANALNCAVAGVLYPVSLFFLMRVLFPARRDVVVAGSVVMLASTQFPWALMIFGPLYPNMLAYALMPAVAACFICWLGPVRTFGRKGGAAESAAACYPLARPAAHGRWFALVLVGMVTCVFAQPNAVFSLGVFLVPYIVAKSYGHGRRRAMARTALESGATVFPASAASAAPVVSAAGAAASAATSILPTVPAAPDASGAGGVLPTAPAAPDAPAAGGVPRIRAGRAAGLRWALAACVLIALAWIAVFSVPLVQAVAGFTWAATKTLLQALRESGLFMFRFASLNVALTACLWLGIAWTLKHRRWLWVSCSFVVLSALYVVAQTVDGPVKALLTGFWYTDSLRLAAAAVIFAMPLVAMGFAALARLLAGLLARLFRMESPDRAHGEARKIGSFTQKNARTCRFCGLRASVGAVLAALFLVVSFGPSVPISLGPLGHLGPDDEWIQPSTGMGAVVGSLASMTDGAVSPKLTDDEREFIRQVQQIVPAGEPIANLPFDGSAWAFGAMGLNDYYRYIGTYGVEGETPESRLVRQHLDEYASNADVRAAADKLGIRYVLQLDQGAPVPGPQDAAFLHAVGDGFDWSGLTDITDDTPGFTPVLSQGDMRLYKIG